MFASFGKKLGAETEYLVSRDFLSGQEDKELLLLRFLHLAFALGPGKMCIRDRSRRSGSKE